MQVRRTAVPGLILFGEGSSRGCRGAFYLYTTKAKRNYRQKWRNQSPSRGLEKPPLWRGKEAFKTGL